MNGRQLLQYGMTKAGATEEAPFGPGVAVLNAGGKMFALFGRRQGNEAVSLKCDPDYAELLRRQHPCIEPGYHLNKRHWNTIDLTGGLPDAELTALLDQSYELVVRSLGKKQRQLLQEERNGA